MTPVGSPANYCPSSRDSGAGGERPAPGPNASCTQADHDALVADPARFAREIVEPVEDVHLRVVTGRCPRCASHLSRPLRLIDALRPEPGVTVAWLRQRLRAQLERRWREMVAADLAAALAQAGGHRRWEGLYADYRSDRTWWFCARDVYLLSLGLDLEIVPGGPMLGDLDGRYRIGRDLMLPYPSRRRR